MIHAIFIAGKVKSVQIRQPKHVGKNPTALVLVQYGEERNRTGQEVEFINAVMVRVPDGLFSRIESQLQVGAQVQVNGHLQGVSRVLEGVQHFSTELVADRLVFESAYGADEAANGSIQLAA